MITSQACSLTATGKSTGLTFVLILSALMAFTSLSTDIYLPAMPVMANDLQGDAELTITGFLVGFCIAQLIWGPISDRFGRRLPLLLALRCSSSARWDVPSQPVLGKLFSGECFRRWAPVPARCWRAR